MDSTVSQSKMRKKAGLEELAGFAELAELAGFMLLMASSQGSRVRGQLSSVPLTTSIVRQREVIICKTLAAGPASVWGA